MKRDRSRFFSLAGDTSATPLSLSVKQADRGCRPFPFTKTTAYSIAAALAFCLLQAGIMTGCDGIDNYSVDPNHRLRFSVDTLFFDTVFTSVGSVTRQFMVYNPNDAMLRIESVQLAGAGKNGFRINVDGRRGDSFREIEIWKHDSLYVSVEITPPPNGENTPLLLEDSVVFLVNGVRQSVLLQACGQDVHLLRGGVTFARDTTLAADRPWLVYDSLRVDAGATLTLDRGVTVYMHSGASLTVAGTLRALGTREEPVIFRGDRLDEIALDVPLLYDRIPGQWQGIRFTGTSFENEFNHVIVRNGFSGLTFEESDPERMKIRILNSQITNMSGSLLTSVNCRIEAANSEFTNATNAVLMLVGGDCRFTHCTVASHKKIGNPGRDVRTPCLILANRLETDDGEQSFPLLQARFENCIVDGSFPADSTQLYRGELLFSTTSEEEAYGNETTFNYRFNACLLKTARVENARFTGNLFIQSPTYLKTGTKEEGYAFDFRLAEKSAGIGKGDRSVAEEYPEDRYGINRLSGETSPTIGAYEYVPQKEDTEE
jgi:hypothetical protein